MRPVERILVAYAAFVVAVASARGFDHPAAWWAGAGHALLIALIWLLARGPASRLASLIREGLPIAVLPLLYAAIDGLNGFGARPVHDAAIQTAEAWLFGGQPARDWWAAATSPSWSSVFHAAYLTYYLIVPLPIVLFLAQRRVELARSAAAGIVAVFCACYAVFILLPVAGPYYEFQRPAAAMLDNLPARAVYGVLAHGSSYGAAFPSSHVAATWVAVAATARGAPKLAAGLALPAVLLTVGVVYTQMHYAVDVLAGLVVAATAVFGLRLGTPGLVADREPAGRRAGPA